MHSTHQTQVWDNCRNVDSIIDAALARVTVHHFKMIAGGQLARRIDTNKRAMWSVSLCDWRRRGKRRLTLPLHRTALKSRTS
eukprot:9474288-Pyramimonas_sp.AAC.1